MSKCFDLPDKLECFKGNVFLQCFGCCDKSSTTENGFAIIYPNGGTKEQPAIVTNNQRIVMDNPFPGYEVMCRAEVEYNGSWGETGWFSSYLKDSYDVQGIKASQLLPEDKVVVQSGYKAVLAASFNAGNPFDMFTPAYDTTSLPCRVKVWKLNKIED